MRDVDIQTEKLWLMKSTEAVIQLQAGSLRTALNDTACLLTASAT